VVDKIEKIIFIIPISFEHLCFNRHTAVPENYFTLMEKEIEKTGADILLPCVFDGNGYMSPCKISGVSVSAISSLEELNEENISGINSGMAVKTEVFKAYRYDENYFLDFIDHKFLSDMKKQKRKIAAAKSVELKQSFSANDFSDIKAARRRFAVFKKDYSLFCRQAGGLKNKLIGALVIAKRFININFIGRLRSK
jgi:rhamnosyltransferase